MTDDRRPISEKLKNGKIGKWVKGKLFNYFAILLFLYFGY
jgi:hypothetical protein